MTNWNFSEAVYQLGDSAIADQPALVHADQVVSFRQLRRRALGIAAYLDQLGLPAGSHVGHYLRNSPAYLEMFTGAGLAGCYHVNVNYRYMDEELIGLCNSLDIRVLVYDSEFGDRVAAIRQQLDKTVAFVEVGEGPVQDFAARLSDLCELPPGQFTPRTSGNDQVLVATGGTTGLPKGTQWRHEDLWRKMGVAQRYRMASLGLEEHPQITDALVVGLPHPRFGKQVVAVVEGPGVDDDSLDVDAIQAYAGEHLADHKVPRLVFAIPSLQRAPNGKPDYAFVTD